MRIVEENGRGVGKEGAVPEAVDAAVEDVDLLAGVEADRGGVGVFAVHEDFVAEMETRLEGGCELLGAEDWVEDAERDVSAFDEDNHHGDERPVCGLNFAAAAEKPVEHSAEEEGQCGADQGAAEETHGVTAEIKHVPEGQGVQIGIFVEQVKKFHARSRCVRDNGERAGDGSDEESEYEKDCCGASACSGDGRADGSFGFLSHPVAQKQREAGEAGSEIVFLPRGKAEEEKNDGRPAEKEQENGFGGTANAGDAWQAKANLGERLGKERTPGQEPEKDEAVEKKDGDGVVIHRITLAEVSEELFVDEIKPEEALGLARRWIGEGGEDVPGSSDEEKYQSAGEEMHLQQVAKVAREKKEDENDGAGEDDADESLGEDVERDDGGDAPAGKQRGLFRLPAVEEEIEGDADPEADGDVGNENPSEKTGADCSEKHCGGPEAGLWRQEATAKEIEQKRKREDAQVQRDACAPGVDPEELDADGNPPVGERGFFEVADAVFVERDPVMTDKDLAPGVGMGRINVVLKRRGEEAGAVDG